MLLAAFVIVVTTENQSHDYSRLADHGVLAHARIDRVFIEGETGSLAVSFETADGTTVHKRLTVPRETAVRARHEKAFITLKVVYLPEDPSVVREAGERNLAGWRYLIAGLMAGGALLAAFARLRRTSN